MQDEREQIAAPIREALLYYGLVALSRTYVRRRLSARLKPFSPSASSQRRSGDRFMPPSTPLEPDQ